MRVLEIITYKAYCDTCEQGTGPGCGEERFAYAFLKMHLKTDYHKEKLRVKQEEQEKEVDTDSSESLAP